MKIMQNRATISSVFILALSIVQFYYSKILIYYSILANSFRRLSVHYGYILTQVGHCLVFLNE